LIVFSGGQTGADEAGLRAAKACGLQTGGFMPRGWKTQAGPRPEFAEEFGLKQLHSPFYPVRTEKNVSRSDVTIIFGHEESRGCRLTKRLCVKWRKPVEVIPMCAKPSNEGQCFHQAVDKVVCFLEKHTPRVVNIAGNREEKTQGIFGFTEGVLIEAFVRLGYEPRERNSGEECQPKVDDPLLSEKPLRSG